MRLLRRPDPLCRVYHLTNPARRPHQYVVFLERRRSAVFSGRNGYLDSLVVLRQNARASVLEILANIGRQARGVLDLGDCTDLLLIELDQYHLISEPFFDLIRGRGAEPLKKAQYKFSQRQGPDDIKSRRDAFQRALGQAAQALYVDDGEVLCRARDKLQAVSIEMAGRGCECLAHA